MNVINTVRRPAWLAALEAGLARAGVDWRPVWQRWLAARRQRRTDGQDWQRAERSLVALDARTLRDIGAPDRLMAHAEARLGDQRDERAALHIGAASGAWRHW